jgi:cellulose synthase/poly-beta-1,6-N-acetylglucosamine synthase-like glycosyltransferase
MFYPLPKTWFEEIVGRLFYPDMNKVADDWKPSSRSAAFTKKVWEKSGGYPEELYTAEDSIFNYRLKALGARYMAARDAKSYWRPRPSFRKFLKQYFTYAKGNGESLLALYRYPENRMFYVFWGEVLIAIVSYLYFPILFSGLLLAFLGLMFLRAFLVFRNLGKGLIGASLLLSAFVANAFGNHYGLLRRALGMVKARKVRSIKVLR